MKIALFSDIHSNLPAMEAFFKDIDTRKPDAIYCLGDLLGYNNWPFYLIKEARKRGIVILSGNQYNKSYLLSVDTNIKKINYQLLDQNEDFYARMLPENIQLKIKTNETSFNVVLVHVNSLSNQEHILQDWNEEYLRTALHISKADLLFCSHSKKPFHRIVTMKDFLKIGHIINIGSVGRSRNDKPQGCYVMINLHNNSKSNIKDNIQIEFVYFDYKAEKEAKAFEDICLPLELA